MKEASLSLAPGFEAGYFKSFILTYPCHFKNKSANVRKDFMWILLRCTLSNTDEFL